MKFDFGGYATKIDVKCSDGRTIRKNAFQKDDGKKVPLVWQHSHNDPENVLGHAILENREDGVYAYCTFNNTPKARHAKEFVKHGDIESLSIWANNLIQKAGDVVHGSIRELSLVMTGANPEALIDNVVIAHGEGDSATYEEMADQAIICHCQPIDPEEIEIDDDDDDDGFGHSGGGDPTVEDILNQLTDEQQQVVAFLISKALEGEGVKHSDDDEGGSFMKKNVFDKTNKDEANKQILSHDQLRAIMDDALKNGSLKDSFLAHAQTYGIENIDFLFPDAKTITPTPDMIKRDTAWVTKVIDGCKHSPFSRIKSTAADVTADEARAKGYVKGTLKKEEVIKLLKRVTTPTTVYKKQKLDRDDIIDIVDLDVVAWIKAEMRMMLNEELARAALIGDGRDAEDADKINEENIRPIYKDDDMYSHHVELLSTIDTEGKIEAITRSMTAYEGAGSPLFFTTAKQRIDMLLLKDKVGRRIYNTDAELAAALGVAGIVEVPAMKDLKRTVPLNPSTPEDGQTKTLNCIGIIVNMIDYVMGADKGGNISMFDDFDIDYNQYKYLLETRCSGALIHPKSAIVVEQVTAEG